MIDSADDRATIVALYRESIMSDLLAALLFLMGLGPNPDLPPDPAVHTLGGGIPTTPPTRVD
jgi:hypothetical protein